MRRLVRVEKHYISKGGRDCPRIKGHEMTSEEFKATREKLNMTQGHLARKIGLSERSIRYYEQGGRSVPAPVSILLETFLRGLERA